MHQLSIDKYEDKISVTDAVELTNMRIAGLRK